MNASMYSLLILAFLLANWPFLTQRFLGIWRLNRKHFGHHLLEWLLGLLITGLVAYILESRSGSVHSQGWAFYTTVLCLYLVFAFPAFVWRYFWRAKHTS